MKVKELRDILKGYDPELEVMTKKTELLGNVGVVNSVREDTYHLFGVPIPCALLTDEYMSY